jgi:MarR family transcriptional regulator, transcriptional regulator for hemolysin
MGMIAATARLTRPFILQSKSRKRSVLLKLTVIARQMRVSFDRAVERSGLTQAQWTLIAVVARRPGATQRVVAELLELREITAGRIIDRLCSEGYLRRSENPSDRRAYSVHLTPAAQPILEQLDKLGRIHEAKLFAGFNDEDVEKLESLLDALAENLSSVRGVREPQK